MKSAFSLHAIWEYLFPKIMSSITNSKFHMNSNQRKFVSGTAKDLKLNHLTLRISHYLKKTIMQKCQINQLYKVLSHLYQELKSYLRRLKNLKFSLLTTTFQSNVPYRKQSFQIP